MTSSPGSSNAWHRMYSAWMPPVVTMISSDEPTGDPVLGPQLLRQQLEQSRQARGLQVVAAILVDRTPHRALDRLRRVEAHVALVEPERILDAVHHVADADDAGQRDGVEEAAHRVMLVQTDTSGGGRSRPTASVTMNTMATKDR